MEELSFARNRESVFIETEERGLIYTGKEEAGRGCFTEFSLAELLLEKEKFFLPLVGVHKVSCFLLGNMR